MMDFHRYVSGIAEARYAIRKVFRIVDEQARSIGLDPLEHQALVQVYGSPGQMRQVNSVAQRLDIAPAFASRMLKQLEAKGYVERRSSAADRRVTEVHMTEAGRDVLRHIDSEVRVHVEYFQSQLTQTSKTTALHIMAFYIGIDLPEETIEDIVWGEDQTV